MRQPLLSFEQLETRALLSSVSIVDNADAGFATTGTWITASDPAYYRGATQYASSGSGESSARWTFSGLTPGMYRVSATWLAFTNRATNAPYSVTDGSGTLLNTVAVNQQQAPQGLADAGGNWQDLGAAYYITGTSLTVSLSNAANGYVMADGIRAERVGDVPIIDDGQAGFGTSGSWVTGSNQAYYQGDTRYAAAGAGQSIATWQFSQLTPGLYRVSATWTPYTNRATNAPYTIGDGNSVFGTVTVNQQQAPQDYTAAGAGWQNLGTSYLVTGNSLAVSLSNAANGYVMADGVRIERVGDVPQWQVDDGGAGFSTAGSWVTASGQGYYQGSTRYAPAGTGDMTASWTVNGLTPGLYRVSATWLPFTNRATNAPYTVLDGAGNVLSTVAVNQQQAPQGYSAAGVMWQPLGTAYYITGTSLTVSLSNAANGFVMADAIRAERVGDVPIIDDGQAGFSTSGSWVTINDPAYYQNDTRYAAAGTGQSTATWLFSKLTPGLYRVSATWTPYTNRATNAPYTIGDGTTVFGTVPVNQQLAPQSYSAAGAGWQNLGGTYLVTGTTLAVSLSNAANGYVMADGVRIERIAPQWIGDDGGSGFSTVGPWVTASGPGYYQESTRHAPAGAGDMTASWTFTDLAPGMYKVSATWLPFTNRATNAPYTVMDSSGTVLGSVAVNQQQAPQGDAAAGGVWQALGSPYYITGTSLTVTLSNAANGFVMADGVRVERVGDVPIVDDGQAQFSTAGSWVAINDPAYYQGDTRYAAPGAGQSTATWQFGQLTPGLYRVSATWTPYTNRATNAPYTIGDGTTAFGTVTVNQQQAPQDYAAAGTGWRNLGGSYMVLGNTLVVSLSNAANGYVMADGVRIERIGDLPQSFADDGGAAFSATGSWVAGTGQPYYLGNTHYAAPGTGDMTASWAFAGLTPGLYRVYATWLPFSNRATNAPYTVLDGNVVLGTSALNQQLAPQDAMAAGAAWQDFGNSFLITGNSLVVSLSNAANGYVMADGIRIIRVGDVPAGPRVRLLDVNQAIAPGGVDDFGGALLGETRTKQFTVVNVGTLPLTLSAPIILPTGFSLIAGFTTSVVAPGASATFTVQWDGVTTIQPGSTISFGTSDPTTPTFTFSLTGTITPFSAAGNTAAAVMQWVQLYVDTGGTPFTQANTARLLMAAEKRMFLAATINVNDDLNDYPLFDYVLQNPTTPVWSWCDYAADFMLRALRSFNIASYIVQIGQDWGLQHTAMAIYSAAYNKFYFYDALYGVWFLDSNGVPGSPQDIEAQIATYGFDTTNWRYRPVRIYGLDSDPPAVAASAYEGVNGPDYTATIISIQHYWNYVALKSEDFRGVKRWTIYDSTAYSNLSDSLKAEMVTNFIGQSQNAILTTITTPPLLNTTNPVWIIDNRQAGFTADGGFTGVTSGFQGDAFYAAAGTGQSTAAWAFTGLTPGQYRISISWETQTNRADNALFTVLSDGATAGSARLNQKLAPGSFTDAGAIWQDLPGSYMINGTTLTVQLSDDANGYLIADAVRIERIG